ncbi:hypothetical protein ACRAWF_16080 [Streptomyces sp. L7]
MRRRADGGGAGGVRVLAQHGSPRHAHTRHRQRPRALPPAARDAPARPSAPRERRTPRWCRCMPPPRCALRTRRPTCRPDEAPTDMNGDHRHRAQEPVPCTAATVDYQISGVAIIPGRGSRRARGGSPRTVARRRSRSTRLPP